MSSLRMGQETIVYNHENNTIEGVKPTHVQEYLVEHT